MVRIAHTSRRFAVGLCAFTCLVGGIGLLQMLPDDAKKEDDRRQGVADSSRFRQRPGFSQAGLDPYSRRVIQAAQPRQVENFLLLRTAPEGLPARVRQIMRKPVKRMNWNLAQRLPVVMQGEFWLIPGHRRLCILAQVDGLELSCAPTQIAVAHGVAIVALSAGSQPLGAGGSRFIIGVGPDRAQKVLVHTGDSVSLRPVDDYGVFALRDRVTDPPDLLTFRPSSTYRARSNVLVGRSR
jgi:hypothetical protein